MDKTGGTTLYADLAEIAENQAPETRLESSALDLARKHASQKLAAFRSGLVLTHLLEEYNSVFKKSIAYFRKSDPRELALTLAAEWMLDNDYIVQQSVRQVKESLPDSYYHELPKLNLPEGVFPPRVFDLAREIIQLDNAQLGMGRIDRYVQVYQRIDPLMIGEVWALPAMLRLGILESLASALTTITRQPPDQTAFPVEISFSPEITSDEIIVNSIGSLRLLGTQNWNKFFEGVSVVEQILRLDPAVIYPAMDFETRDRYRKSLEEIANQSARKEWEIAEHIVESAEIVLGEQLTLIEESETGRHNSEEEVARLLEKNDVNLPRQAHVGYYLIDEGRSEVQEMFGVRLGTRQRIARWILEHPLISYLGGIGLLTCLVTVALLAYAIRFDPPILQLLLVTILGLIPAKSAAVNLINSLIHFLVPPRVLPKMNFEAEIPESAATLVVIPALLSDKLEADSLLAQIEIHYLRNADDNLFFALLTDFADAPAKVMPEDGELVERLEQGIRDLNNKYTRLGPDPFFLLHRERLWNPQEGIWMGWERKRGKLHELNRLVRGCGDASFVHQVGDVEALASIKYVITLDEDTILPPGTANQLVAAMAHPLNRAEFDPETGQVVSGYTILQPRTEILLSSKQRTFFTRIFAGDRGLDLYTLAVSDIYQDLFGEGIYVGKCIYEVDSFERSLEDRVPENSLLSHDLFEGIHGRTGLISDVMIIEEYPPNYLSWINRTHRWIRGDWQLLPWLFPQVPVANGRRQANRLKTLDRWKIYENLRRSLLVPFSLIFFVAGWFVLPGSPVFWTVAGMLFLGAPVLTSLLDAAHQLIKGGSLRQAIIPVQQNFLRWLLALILLPSEAFLNLDAILSTLVRVVFRKRGLLQWTTAARANHLNRLESRDTWRQMVSTTIFGFVMGLTLVALNPDALWVASPLLAFWIVSPQLVYFLDRPVDRAPERLSGDQLNALRLLARKTWLYFEHFVDPENHWLPPDHFQEAPRGVVAPRTSPTNIGLGLLSTLAAYDFGFLELLDFGARLQAMFDTLNNLERYRGHFLNWYDTNSLQTLSPRYVSTVDSGNLAASLIALEQGCLSLVLEPVVRAESWLGMADIILLIRERIMTWSLSDEFESKNSTVAYLDGFASYLQEVSGHPEKWCPTLCQLDDDLHSSGAGSATNYTLAEMDRLLMVLVEAHADEIGPDPLKHLRIHINRLHAHKSRMKRQAGILAPWLLSLGQLPPAIHELQTNPDQYHLWEQFEGLFQPTIQLDELENLLERASRKRDQLLASLENSQMSAEAIASVTEWLASFFVDIESAAAAANDLTRILLDIGRAAQEFTRQMDFSFLFHSQRKVFHIGYNLETDRLDSNYYDLFASEARIASYVSMAKGEIPQDHWLYLSRPVTTIRGSLALISWSGTMFEYLMPPLLLRSYPDTLLDTSNRAAVASQIEFARRHKIPWGMSESGFYQFDNNQNYQYRAFGDPNLGYKRGLEDDLVVAPYASFLALPLRPESVFHNYENLAALGMLGIYGLYESMDFTKDRLPAGDDYAIIRSFMAHHQGMILLALVNYFKNNVMVERFHKNMQVKSLELLLQEQIPVSAPMERPHPENGSAVRVPEKRVVSEPWRVGFHTPQPRVHVLSNGNYTVLITNAGSGFSRWRKFDLTRWRPDSTLDQWGSWIYIQDADDPRKKLWSAAHQPAGVVANSSEVNFSPAKAEFRRKDSDFSTRMEVTVAPNQDVEIRRISITNHSNRPRRVRLTSYAEVVLADQRDDERHPAFTKLFVEIQPRLDLRALIFRRRLRSAKDEPVVMAHALVSKSGDIIDFAFETDRFEFLGRGSTIRKPQALLARPVRLTSSGSPSLDPVACISTVIELPPHGRAQLAFLTFAAGSREAIESSIRPYQDWSSIDRAFDQARTQAELELRRSGMSGEDLSAIQNLLSVLAFPHKALRAAPEVLSANRNGQSGLWGHNISGDYPLLLVRIQSSGDLNLVQELLRAHAFWRKRRIFVDLVFLNEQGVNYGQELNNQLYRLFTTMKVEARLNQPGGLFVIYADQMGEQDRILLRTAARAILDGSQGSLKDQIQPLDATRSRLPIFVTGNPRELWKRDAEKALPPDRPSGLLFDNGLGGFSPDGREYVINLKPGKNTPLPWANVAANPKFGFLVTESGSSTTWAINSGENRLTPWSNDPVIDPSGEVLYLRDEETAEVWTPTPLPIRSSEPYRIHHGAGYSKFYHDSHGIKQRLRLFVSPEDPVKIVQLRLENLRETPRRITATYYVEWVLGTTRGATQPYIISEYDDESQALLATNHYHPELGARVAFAAAGKPLHGLTADREEFLGRTGNYQYPAALRRVGLAGEIAAGIDPCAALQLHLDLPPRGVEEIYFLLGQGADRQDALRLVKRYKDSRVIAQTWQDLEKSWDRLLGRISVETPDPALDLLLNRWLLYQALSCRFWGRTAFYQPGGAYGFRDQLQDSSAVLYADPGAARMHILYAAAHQFEEGDVLHWWHPPSGRGVRTRISDDLIWLPYVASDYIDFTGDLSILQEKVPFKVGDSLEPHEIERYSLYPTSEYSETLLEHCHRALSRGLTSGHHELPLIGTGDWNDGLNQVGREGRGESVWLAWFLNVTLRRFAEVCSLVGDDTQARMYCNYADELVEAIEKNAWDGDWYRRAYYDDGVPLGSSLNRECQIDSLPQSWAVFSGEGDPRRARQGLQVVADRLVREEDGLILLLTPPFDRTPRDPGYIRGYLPGVRENGGQYTHAALWAVWAFNQIGQVDDAWQLFRLLNPILHGDDPEKIKQYKVEPYVVAADVYSLPPHTGRGGWTWYTGSSGWMYRLGVERFLGIYKSGENLRLDPHIPAGWPGFRIRYRHGDSHYHIEVRNPDGVSCGVRSVVVDGSEEPGRLIPLVDDGADHQVFVELGDSTSGL